jgi:hypothetical protein
MLPRLTSYIKKIQLSQYKEGLVNPPYTKGLTFISTPTKPLRPLLRNINLMCGFIHLMSVTAIRHNINVSVNFLFTVLIGKRYSNSPKELNSNTAIRRLILIISV